MEIFLFPNSIFLLVLKIVFGSISFLMIAGIVYFILKTNYLQMIYFQDVAEILSFRPYGTRKIVKQWNKLKNRLGLPSEAEHKLAIIEADNLLNEVLAKMGYQGETLGEKLKQLSALKLSNLDRAMEAHKIRNSIVYDTDYRLSLEQAQKTVEIYEKFLIELQVL